VNVHGFDSNRVCIVYEMIYLKLVLYASRVTSPRWEADAVGVSRVVIPPKRLHDQLNESDWNIIHKFTAATSKTGP
jgi:hypothetical protein